MAMQLPMSAGTFAQPTQRPRVASGGDFAMMDERAIREDFGNIIRSPSAPQSLSSSWAGEGKQRGYQQMLDMPIEGIDLAKLFPPTFTLALILLFSVPVYMLFHVSHVPAVKYWLGAWPSYFAYAVPILILLAHTVHHSQKGAPSKLAVSIALFGPGIGLLVVSNIVMTESMKFTDMLFSTDCDSFEGKRALQRSWEDARDLWMNCVNATSAEMEGKVSEDKAWLFETFRIQDCDEYDESLRATAERERDWTYLRHLENDLHCSGWCYPGRQLWTMGGHKDSCSVAVASVLSGMTVVPAYQITMITLVFVFIAAAAMIFVGPILRDAGISW